MISFGFSDYYGVYFGKLSGRIRKENLTIASPPMVLFHSSEFSPFGLDTEFVIPIREYVTGTRDFKTGLCLKTVIKGSYSILSSVYAKQTNWAEQNGYECTGALFEVLLIKIYIFKASYHFMGLYGIISMRLKKWCAGGNTEKRLMMNRILIFLKRETVLCVSLILAVASMFLVPLDQSYWGYIDFRTLAILFSLMSVMAGFQKAGVFEWIAGKLLGHVRSGCGLILTLVLLCFFSGMFITNDVALLTFVPFTFTVLGMLGDDRKDRLVLPVVVMQTLAANLGSMLTPVGNPQNLYLYGKAGLSICGFLMLMLPYTILSLVMLVVWGLVQGRRCPRVLETDEVFIQEDFPRGGKVVYRLVVYLVLFLLCLLAVGHILPWPAALLAVVVLIFAADRQVFAGIDYSLLFTFAGFFVFVGNVGRIPAFRAFLQEMIAGREVYTAVIASQIISNVPAALLLSGFTEDFPGLIVGTNLGGLGTLIASMASLISYKYVAKETNGCRGKYIALFTVGNIIFLAALILLYVLLGKGGF